MKAKMPEAARLTALVLIFVMIATFATSCAEWFEALFETGSPSFSTASTAPEITSDTTTYPPATVPSHATGAPFTTPDPPATTPYFTVDTFPPETTSSDMESTYPPATIPPVTRPPETMPPPMTETTVPPETTETSLYPPIITGADPIIRDLTLADVSDEAMEALITRKYLSINSNSRPGRKLWSVRNIVVHYVANPGSSAINNWRYFENVNGVSAHFIIGLDGEILQCMPLDEVAWAIGTTEGNYTSISIECCHPDNDGRFTEATYRSLVKLVSWLCNRFGLGKNDVLRHYDYVRNNGWQKSCPVYYVNNPIEWEKFKANLVLR